MPRAERTGLRQGGKGRGAGPAGQGGDCGKAWSIKSSVQVYRLLPRGTLHRLFTFCAARRWDSQIHREFFMVRKTRSRGRPPRINPLPVYYGGKDRRGAIRLAHAGFPASARGRRAHCRARNRRASMPQPSSKLGTAGVVMLAGSSNVKRCNTRGGELEAKPVVGLSVFTRRGPSTPPPSMAQHFEKKKRERKAGGFARSCRSRRLSPSATAITGRGIPKAMSGGFGPARSKDPRLARTCRFRPNGSCLLPRPGRIGSSKAVAGDLQGEVLEPCGPAARESTLFKGPAQEEQISLRRLRRQHLVRRILGCHVAPKLARRGIRRFSFGEGGCSAARRVGLRFGWRARPTGRAGFGPACEARSRSAEATDRRRPSGGVRRLTRAEIQLDGKRKATGPRPRGLPDCCSRAAGRTEKVEASGLGPKRA